MMTIPELMELKNSLGLTYEQISEKSGVPLSTVQKVLGGITKSPRYDTLCALETLLLEESAKSHPTVTYQTERRGDLLQDSSAGSGAYHALRYTASDRAHLPKERRTELIDGVLYDMASPSILHQFYLWEISKQIDAGLEEHDCGCNLFIAPLDVNLDHDEWTRVQPDIMVVCHKEQLNGNEIEGAPDFVIEILSRATKNKDEKLKLRKYSAAGVREYWLVDLQQMRVTTFNFDETRSEEPFVSIYGLDGCVPVGISGGQLKVDFDKIQKRAAQRLND